jgi:hypothetical protein
MLSIAFSNASVPRKRSASPPQRYPGSDEQRRLECWDFDQRRRQGVGSANQCCRTKASIKWVQMPRKWLKEVTLLFRNLHCPPARTWHGDRYRSSVYPTIHESPQENAVANPGCYQLKTLRRIFCEAANTRCRRAWSDTAGLHLSTPLHSV